MKSQRRHELQTNELAAVYDKYADEIKQYGTIAVVVVAVAVVGGLVWAISANSQQQKLASGWKAFDEARSEAGADTESLEEMATDKAFANTPPAWWALKTAADRKLSTGMRQLMQDRDKAKDDIEEAITAYEEIVDKGSSDTMLQQQCLLGLGKAHESLSNLDEAKTYFDKAVKLNAANSLGRYAAERYAFLANDANAEWYTWFSKQKPRPPIPPSRPGTPPSSVGDDLPSAPDISFEGGGLNFEGLGSGLENKDGETVVTPPGDTTPESTDTPDSTDTPATDDSPADDPASDPAADDAAAPSEDAAPEGSTETGPASETDSSSDES